MFDFHWYFPILPLCSTYPIFSPSSHSLLYQPLLLIFTYCHVPVSCHFHNCNISPQNWGTFFFIFSRLIETLLNKGSFSTFFIFFSSEFNRLLSPILTPATLNGFSFIWFLHFPAWSPCYNCCHSPMNLPTLTVFTLQFIFYHQQIPLIHN